MGQENRVGQDGFEMQRAQRNNRLQRWASWFASGLLPIFLFSMAHSQEDVTAPELLELSFTPKTIDTTNSAQQVIVTARITNGESGLVSANLRFFSPSGTQQTGGILRLVSGTPQDGTYRVVVSFPQFSEQGTWTIADLSMRDKVGNRTTLRIDDFRARGFPTDVEVGPIFPLLARLLFILGRA